MFGLIGPDGAGKTTTIRLMCGLLKADAGTVRVLGRDPVKEHLHVTQSIGYLSQRFSLYGDLSIDENIAFFAEIHGLRMSDPAHQGAPHAAAGADAAGAVSRSPGRSAVRRHEAEARAGLHAGPRAAGSSCSTSRRPASIRCRAANSGSCCRSFWPGHHDPDGDAVSRRGRALLARGAAARGPAAGAGYAGGAAGRA